MRESNAFPPYIVIKRSGLAFDQPGMDLANFFRDIDDPDKSATVVPRTIIKNALSNGGKVFLGMRIGNIGAHESKILKAGFSISDSEYRSYSLQSLWCGGAEGDGLTQEYCQLALAPGQEMRIYLDITPDFDRFDPYAQTTGIGVCVQLPTYGVTCDLNSNVKIEPK
ncbi:Uncharacterised protein [Mycobacteroides abscessus]|nr:Uncharacterised protein [Mycobacteroides abscessus]CPY44650.1 Uncharacterised protein [Mycobacteroides abscessus]CPY52452.1 Uncharacterised protein [Mycobacteroides abscessus]